MPDVYPGDFITEFTAMKKRIEELEAIVRSRPALTHASTGWRMTDMAIPSVADGEIHIGANAGELYVATSSDVKRITQLNVPGTAPTFPGTFSSPATISAAPTAANYNALRADVVDQLFTPLRQVITSARDIGLWPGS